AVARKLKAPHALKDGFHFLFADAMDPPFQDQSLDVVLTPWFIDIVPQDIGLLFAKINRVLKPGGVWINLGSTAFVPADVARRYTPEDVLATFANTGVELTSSAHESIPYMCSTASCDGRREKVLVFCARKTAEVEQPASFQYLPDWLIHPDKPIPKSQDIVGKAVAHRIYFEVLALIDGSRSIRDVAALVAK